MLDTASDSRVARVNLFRGVRLCKGLVLGLFKYKTRNVEQL